MNALSEPVFANLLCELPDMTKDTYFSAPGVATVRWDQPSSTVLVEWEGWANTAEFKALLEGEIQALKDHAGSRLLADCRRQRVLNPADQERADHEWLPRAIEAGLKRFAIVLPVSDMAAGHIQERLGKVPRTTMRIAYFGSVE